MSKLTDDTLESHYSGSALLRLLTYMKPYLGWFALCLALILALTGFELYRPVLIGDAIDLFEADANYDVIIDTSIKYAVVLLFSFVFNISQTWLLQKTGQRIILSIRRELYIHIQSLSSRYFDLTPVGKLVTRVTNDVEALNEMYSGILVRLFRNIVKIAGLATIMLIMDWKLALISFVLLPVVVALTIVFRKIARETYRLARTRLTDLNTFLSENISGMRVIQIFGREKRKFEEFDDKSHKLYQAFYREMMVFAIFRPVIYILSVLSLIIVLGVGSKEVLGSVITIGTLYIFAQYIQSFFDPIQELAEQFSTLQSSLASAEKIFTILDEEPLVKEEAEPVILPQIKGRIEFSHVWFAYDNENYVLRDVSFVIEPGQKVAFVGATGAGKSSILNLIGRYYDIQKGNIYIDGVDIRKLSKKQLRSAIGQMQQDVFIFEGTVESNIRLHDNDISPEEVKAAAEYVNASHFIERLPQGYAEPVSERGSTFSAGERQLLSFARTLAHKPSILVMVMHKGKIREKGTHQELLAQGGIYKKLYELQIHHEISA